MPESQTIRTAHCRITKPNLYEAVTGRERHLVQVGRVPRAHDDPAILGAVLDGVDYVGQLKRHCISKSPV